MDHMFPGKVTVYRIIEVATHHSVGTVLGDGPVMYVIYHTKWKVFQIFATELYVFVSTWLSKWQI